MPDTSTFQYELEVLRSKEADLSAVSQDLADIKRTIRRLNDMVSNYWAGSTAKLLKYQNDRTIDRANEIKDSVDSLLKNLRDAIRTYDQNESKSTSMVDNLSTDSIF